MENNNKYTILLPTYNEKENLPIVIWLIVKYMNERYVVLCNCVRTSASMFVPLVNGCVQPVNPFEYGLQVVIIEQLAVQPCT